MITVKQAADRLGVDPSQVRRLIYSQQIKANKPGVEWLISEQALRTYEGKRRKRGRPRKQEG